MALIQVMPNTYENLRQGLGFGIDPFDPQDDIIAGAALLAAMYNGFGSPGLLAAYDAGPERYDASLKHGTRYQRRLSPICERSVRTLPKAV
jgi:soluble lytic murein transglycosylase-like protein